MFRKLIVGLILVACWRAIQADGWMVIIGGGQRPESIVKEIIRLAGGPDRQILIVPSASENQLDSALYARYQFESCGANLVRFVLFNRENLDQPENIQLVKKSQAVYFTGGDQNRLTALLNGSIFLEEIKNLYRRGGVISGTSAGAAVFSKIMLTGEEEGVPGKREEEEQEKFTKISRGAIKTVPGFGFLENAIVDQHFIRRKRFNRLISLILENPQFIGIGIDEETAVVVENGRNLRVIGNRTVMIIDCRKCGEIKTGKNNFFGAREIVIHLLIDGDRFQLSPGKEK